MGSFAIPDIEFMKILFRYININFGFSATFFRFRDVRHCQSYFQRATMRVVVDFGPAQRLVSNAVVIWQ